MESKREQEVLQTVLSKAWEDQAFRKNLTENPISTIENFTGVKIVMPEGKTLVVIDQSDNSKVYMNIPAEPDLENMELTEDQLENIAGGGQNVMGDIVNALFVNIRDFIRI